MSVRFAPIIGHERVTSYLERVLDGSRMAHAYTFEGAEHLGKRAVAEIFAAAFLGISSDTGEKLHSHPDFFLLEPGAKDKNGKIKKNIGIDEVRELIHRLSLSALRGTRKAAIIDDAQNLSPEAANALLKTLEEPRGDVCIILVVGTSESLPKTVISRTEVLHFALVSALKIENSLTARGIAPELSREVSALVFGRPGLAIKLCADGGAAEASYKEEMLRDIAVFSAPISERFKFVEKFMPERASDGRERVLRALDRFENLLRDMLAISLGVREAVAHEFAFGALSALAGGRSPLQFVRALKAAAESREDIGINISPRMTLENFLLKL